MASDHEGASRRAVVPWWERSGRLVLGFWFIFPGILAPLGALWAYYRGGLMQSLTPLTATGMGLVFVLIGGLALAGRLLLPTVMIVISLLGTAASLAGIGTVSLSDVGGGVSVLASSLLLTVALLWIAARRLREAGGFQRIAASGLMVAFGINIPLLGMKVGRDLGSLLAPAPVSQVAHLGQRLHGLRFLDLSGGTVQLTEPATLYVLNFWATWCVPCREELPLLLEMFKALPAEAPVRLMAVNTEGLDRESIETFLEKEGLQGLDAYTDPAGAQDLLGTGTIPLTVVIRDRTLLTRHVGYGPDTVPSLKAEILHYLREGGPEPSPRPPS